ncbi:MAG: TonB-dependent receptor [Steroidobacteraceae bacterium]
MSVIGASELQNLQITNLQDLAQLIPGLQFAQTPFSTPVYTLRGVGFYESTLSAYPDVTVYLDQVPLPFPALTALANFDLAQVEVLKGPQGTLFGANATGGAINYIAAKPTKTLRSGVSLSFGNYSEVLADGYLSGPISDELSGRIAFRSESRADWQESYTRADSIGAVKTVAARGLLDWTPAPWAKFELNLNGWVDKSEPQQPQLYGLSIQNPGFAPPYELNYPMAPHTPTAADWDPSLPLKSNNSLFQASLRSDFFVGALTITSLTSYIHSSRDTYSGSGGVDFENADWHQFGKFDDFYQEVRVANDSSAALRWTVGANYAYDDVHERVPIAYGDNSLFYALGISSSTFTDNVRSNSYAGFANVEADAGPAITVKVGGRFTGITRRAFECHEDGYNGKVAAFFTMLESLLSGGAVVPPLGINDCFPINPQTGRSGPYFGSLNEHNVSWRVGVDWKPSDTLLIYVNAAKGYKAGGFPAVDASSWVQFKPVTQESVVDVELGFKSQSFDNRLSVTGSVFHYDYKDKQLRSKILDPVFGLLDATSNIPKSTVKGAELAVAAKPVKGLTLTLSATYLDAKIDQFTGINNAGGQADFAGTKMPYAPRFSGTFDGEYRWTLGNGWTPFLGVNATHSGATNAVIGETPKYAIPAFTVFNLRAGVEDASHHWKGYLWSKNLTNKYYINNVVQNYDTVTRYTGMPRTYGVAVSYSY